jgi:hypothetical protein
VEYIRAGAALEREMSKRRHRLGAGLVGLIVAALLILHPQRVEAHSADVLLARLRLQDGPEVTLQVTADVQRNPWLRHAPNPVEVLGAGLRIVLPSGRSFFLSELKKPEITLHQGFEPPSPVAITFDPGEAIPELLTATWVWRPSESPLRLEVPLGNPNSVLFWKTEPRTEAPSAGWQVLVAGDQSREVTLPAPLSPLHWNWMAYTAATVAGCGLLLQAALLFLRVRKHFGRRAQEQAASPTGGGP